MFNIRHSSITDVGLQRTNNEDAFFGSAKDGLWIVADGMGGHAAGEVASSIVTETIQREVAAGKSLQEAIQKSHHEILNAANSGVGGMGMGSTVVALLSRGLSYEICWVGDSRAYIFCPATDQEDSFELRQLTTDHSYVQMLYQSGAISKSELETHPEKNIITQCLGSVELAEVSVETIHGEWSPGSYILLCSDGLSDVVRHDRIKQIMTEHKRLTHKNQWLVNAALDGGGKDNITTVVIEAPKAIHLWFQNLKQSLAPSSRDK